MNFQQLAYLFFTFSLAAVFAGIIAYYYNPGRKQQVEKPKHSMLEEEDR
ncbi:cbb3-type cytochrome c oxidase subunit 3 [Chlorobium limicola]